MLLTGLSASPLVNDICDVPEHVLCAVLQAWPFRVLTPQADVAEQICHCGAASVLLFSFPQHVHGHGRRLHHAYHSKTTEADFTDPKQDMSNLQYKFRPRHEQCPQQLKKRGMEHVHSSSLTGHEQVLQQLVGTDSKTLCICRPSQLHAWHFREGALTQQ